MTEQKTEQKPDHEKRIREALALNITGDKWESDGAGVYSICDSDLEVAVCFTQDSEDAAFIAACNPAAIRALLADLDAMRGALFEAFQEGYWARSTYNDAETSDFQEEWNRSTAKDRALKGAEA